MKLFCPKFAPGDKVLFKDIRGIILGTIEYCRFIEEEQKWMYACVGFHNLVEEESLIRYYDKNQPALKFELDFI